MAHYDKKSAAERFAMPFGAILLGLFFCGVPVHAAEEIPLDQQLLQAAENGQSNKVAELLKEGANVDSRNHIGETPLMLAVTNNHDAVVDQLLDAEADIAIRDYHGTNALGRALWPGKETIILEKLLRAGANKEETVAIGINKWTPLMIVAASGGEKDKVAALLSAGANIEGNRVEGGSQLSTPLTLASDRGRINIVRQLLEAGANAEVRNASNRTPIMQAADARNEAMVQALLYGGARWPTKEEAAAAGVSERGQQILEAEIDKYKLAIEELLNTLPRDLKNILYDQLGQRRISEQELRMLRNRRESRREEEQPPAHATFFSPEEVQEMRDEVEALGDLDEEELTALGQEAGELAEELGIGEEEIEQVTQEMQSLMNKGD